MSSKQEQAAGQVKAWVETYGGRDVNDVAEDIIEILRICHDYRSQPGKAPLFAGDLADSIAEYVQGAFGPAAARFDDEEPDDAAHTSTSGVESD